MHEKPSSPTFRSHTWQRFFDLPGEDDGEEDSGDDDSSPPADWGDAWLGAEVGEDEADKEAEVDKNEEEEGIGMGRLGTVLIDSEKDEAVEEEGMADGRGEAGTAGKEEAGAGRTIGVVSIGAAAAAGDETGEEEAAGGAAADSDDWANAAVRALVD